MPLRAPTHFLVVMPTLVIVFIAAMISAGCGGGSKQTKATPLNQQYEQALKIPAHDVRATRLIGIATQQVARKNEIAADKTLEAAILAAKSVDNAGH